MIKKLFHLFLGEIVRLFKYKIILFSLIVSAIWVIILALLDEETALELAPTLIMMDAGIMSVIFLGSSFFFEKQEGTLHALLISPVPLSYVLASKVFATVFLSTMSYLLLTGTIVIMHGFVLQVIPLLIYVWLCTLAHSAIGYLLILPSKDFMQMLVRFMGLSLLFVSPILLNAVEALPSRLTFLYDLSPSYAAGELVQSTISSIDTLHYAVSLIWLILLPVVIYPTFVYKKFESVAITG